MNKRPKNNCVYINYQTNSNPSKIFKKAHSVYDSDISDW